MIVKNKLLNFKNKYIYQDNDCFLFSLDSVLLANFVTIKLSDKKIIDLCCGNAPIPMLLSFRTNARIFGVEIQKNIYDLAIKSINENGMDKQINILNADVCDICDDYVAESFDVVTFNPPYFKYKKDSLVNDNVSKTIARHEVKIDLNTLFKVSSYLVKNGGTIAFVHRTERFAEIMFLMKKYNIEPKKVRFVYPKIDSDSNLVLIEGVKNGKLGLKLLSPLIVHNSNNEYTEYIKTMFGG